MTNNKIQQLIEQSHKYRAKNTKYHNLFSIEVFVSDPLPENIDLNSVFSFINDRIPPFIINLVDVVYIGFFQDLEDRNINAKYSDGAIYVTNEQDSGEDMADDIIHELAHALEEAYGQDIYQDGTIEQEFLGKRKKLERLLRYMQFDTHLYDFEKTEYDKRLDFFLHKDIGYDIVDPLVNGLFVDAYAATSLREYFATGFEDYYLNNGEFIKNMNPVLYRAINNLNDLE